MTPQEQEMIDGLISRIRNTKVENKDTAAEQHLQQGLAGYPDAVYVLAQTVLVQQYGLQQAQTQMEGLKKQNADLQDQLQQQPAQSQNSNSGGGFLSHIFGGGSSHPSAPAQPQEPQYQPVNSPGYGQGAYTGGGYPPPPPAYPPQGYPAQGGGMFGGGGGGFLSGALQTAAGVAAGEAMFTGMESLFHGFDRGGGGSGFSGMGGGGGETVVNNYYDDTNDAGRGDDRGRDDSGFYNASDDASRSDDSSQLADTGSDDGSGQDFDSASDDSGSFDDNTSMDDSGSGGF